ncbi:MAG: hypothetical protein JSU07_08965 [Bacteroidetes bacterium]|nr:hypothetical protein [Bacteroidota bacterium]
MKRYIAFFILLQNIFWWANAQNYTYDAYEKDALVSQKISRLLEKHEIDSVNFYLKRYQNKLGFNYYKIKFLTDTTKENCYKYLDSAFSRGMTPLCIDKFLNKYDTNHVQQSFKRNYLKAYVLSLIQTIDSIHYKDQEYRQQVALLDNWGVKNKKVTTNNLDKKNDIKPRESKNN